MTFDQLCDLRTAHDDLESTTGHLSSLLEAEEAAIKPESSEPSPTNSSPMREDSQDRPTKRITKLSEIGAGGRYSLAGAQLVGIREYAGDAEDGTPIYTTYLGTEHPERVISDVIRRIGLAEFFRAGGEIFEIAPPPEETGENDE